jgi:dihydrofolate reductase
VAVASNGVIGRDGDLPWHLPADLAHFKKTTMGKPILMGRRTWESIGRVLPGRNNIVITHQRSYVAAGCQVVHSLPEALRAAGDAEEIMIIGGAGLYEEALPLARRIHMTRVHADIEGDTRFPWLNQSEWDEVSRVECEADEQNFCSLSFLTLERNSG